MCPLRLDCCCRFGVWLACDFLVWVFWCMVAGSGFALIAFVACAYECLWLHCVD